MINMFKWALHYRTPFWINMIALLVMLSVSFIALVITVSLLVSGYWIIPPIFWIALPFYVLMRAYKNRAQD